MRQAILFPMVYVDFAPLPLAIGFLLLGLALEGMQLLFILLQVGYPHAVEISDENLNSLGVMVGYEFVRVIR